MLCGDVDERVITRQSTLESFSPDRWASIEQSRLHFWNRHFRVHKRSKNDVFSFLTHMKSELSSTKYKHEN